MATLSSLRTEQHVNLTGLENASFEAILKSYCFEDIENSVGEIISLGSKEDCVAIGCMKVSFDPANKSFQVKRLVIQNNTYTEDSLKNLLNYLFQRCNTEHIENFKARIKGKYVDFFKKYEFQFTDPHCENQAIQPEVSYELQISQEVLKKYFVNPSSPSTSVPSISQFLMEQSVISCSLIGHLPAHCDLTVVGEGAEVENRGPLNWNYKNALPLTHDVRVDSLQQGTKAFWAKVSLILPEGKNEARIKFILDRQFCLRGSAIIVERGKLNQLANITVSSFIDAGNDTVDHCQCVAHKTLVPISQRDKIEEGRITVTVSNNVLIDSDKHINYKIGV